MKKAILFDMDGTILNTLQDITDCMNASLKEIGYAHDFSEEEIKYCFGCGFTLDIQKSMALAKGCPVEKIEDVGVTIPLSHWSISKEDEKKVKDRFTHLYSLHCNDHAAPYDGIPELLKTLQREGYALGVASNKNQPEVERLAKIHFPGLFNGIIGNSDTIRRKPHSDMIDKLLEMFHVKHENAIYIGDSEVDMETAGNAHLPYITVSWGFRGRHFLENHHASVIVDTCDSLLHTIYHMIPYKEKK